MFSFIFSLEQRGSAVKFIEVGTELKRLRYKPRRLWVQNSNTFLASQVPETSLVEEKARNLNCIILKRVRNIFFGVTTVYDRTTCRFYIKTVLKKR